MGVADELAAGLAIWDQTGDLADYAHAIGEMFKQVELYANDTDTTVGWQLLWDVDLAPTAGLPWLAQVVGERVPGNSTDDQARALIRAAPNQDRGTPQAIADAVKQCLTGSQTIGMQERHYLDGTADDDVLAIFTYESETPDANAVIGALRRTVPADIFVDFAVLDGADWTGVETGMSDWTDLESTYGPTWADVAASHPGYVIF